AAAPTTEIVASARAQPPSGEPDAPDQATGAGAGTSVAAAILGALCAIAAVLAAAALFLRGRGRPELRRRRPGLANRRTEDVGRLVRAAVDEGLHGLDESDADPRRAIIACWVRLEQAAAAAGTSRAAGETSTDLVARVLAGHRVNADVLR